MEGGDNYVAKVMTYYDLKIYINIARSLWAGGQTAATEDWCILENEEVTRKVEDLQICKKIQNRDSKCCSISQMQILCDTDYLLGHRAESTLAGDIWVGPPPQDTVARLSPKHCSIVGEAQWECVHSRRNSIETQG